MFCITGTCSFFNVNLAFLITSSKFNPSVKKMNHFLSVTTFKRFGLGIVFLWFFVGGVGHFTNAEFFIAIVPPWVPFPVWAVYISGIFEIVLALLVLWPNFRPFAGWGLILLTLAVTPANIHMFMNPELFPQAPQSAYLIRLVVQVLLLLLIWWSTKIQKSSDMNV